MRRDSRRRATACPLVCWLQMRGDREAMRTVNAVAAELLEPDTWIVQVSDFSQ